MHWPLRKKRQPRKRLLRKKRRLRKRLLRKKRRLGKRLLPKRRHRLRRKLLPKNGRFFGWVEMTSDGACSIRRFFVPLLPSPSVHRPIEPIPTAHLFPCLPKFGKIVDSTLLLTARTPTWNDQKVQRKLIPLLRFCLEGRFDPCHTLL